jgi:hypothetical protein
MVQPVVHQTNHLNPRNWAPLQWLMAVVGFFVAWIITDRTWNTPFSDSLGSNLIWVGAFIIGFFGGGALAGMILAQRNHSTTTVTAVTVQVQPETPPAS